MGASRKGGMKRASLCKISGYKVPSGRTDSGSAKSLDVVQNWRSKTWASLSSEQLERSLFAKKSRLGATWLVEISFCRVNVHVKKPV